MNYIILDLEWNQSARGRDQGRKNIPFEIIQIGAVKVNEKKEIAETFNRVIRPVVYPKLHPVVREVISLTEKELQKGMGFKRAFEEFRSFCGSDFIFCTWGTQDLWQLQQNMAYYKIPNHFPKLLRYYDVQKLFSILYEDGKLRRTEEYAVDALHLEKDRPFHSAVNDAWYVAKIFRKISENPEVMERVSVDYFKPPLRKEEEICLEFATYTKYVTRVFPSREELMDDREVCTVKCPVCGRNLRKKIHWFTANTKKYYCVAKCNSHGMIRGKIQLKKRNDDQNEVFAIKIIKPVTEDGVEKIRQMKKQVTEKRRLKRMHQRQENSV